MLGLQIAAPEDLVVKLVVVLLEKLDCLGVGHMTEFARHDMVEAVEQSLVDELVEERHLLGRVLQHVGNDKLDHILGDAHVIRQIGKRHLGLDHPELGSVARGVGVFGAEGRTEGVDVAEGLRECLDVQLTGHGQIRLLAEEILRVVDRTVFESRGIAEVQRRHLEHLACALAVRARDERRMHVHKAPLLEELVDGVGHDAAHAEDRLEGVGSRAQMRKGAQELHRVALGLNREIRGRRTLDRDFARLNFKRLFCLRRQYQCAGDDHRSADVELRNFLEVRQLRAEDNLHLREIRAIGEIDEAEVFACTQVADPAADPNGLSVKAFAVFKQRTDGSQLFHHGQFPLSSIASGYSISY